MDKETEIIVIGGGGTFGASTALELARRGYKHVLALDPYPCPSKWSAGNDLNKIVRTEYADPFYDRLAGEAVQAWHKDPLFRDHFHQTGWLVTSSDPSKVNAWKGHASASTGLLSAGELDRKVPQLEYLQARSADWWGAWNPQNGWVAAKDALRVAGTEAQRLGVRFISGPAGHVVDLDQTPRGRVRVKTLGGQTREADHVIVCIGAWIDKLVDMKGQISAKCWTVGHLQLTPQECKQLRGMPVIVDAELGFFFEPSQDGKLKFCNEFPGYTNHMPSPWSPSSRVSIPSPIKYAIPDEARVQLDQMRKKLFPRFVDRPIQDVMVCWCADTPDRSWIIDKHPDMSNVLLATGDSGMAFKFLPTIGKYIVDALEDKLDPDKRAKWKWRPEMTALTQDQSRGPGHIKDLKQLRGWPGRAAL